MSDFNPYRDWLDLEVTDKPTYYHLFDVSPSETDTEAIRNQARRQLHKLEKIDDPSREPLKQRLVTQIKRGAKVLSSANLRKKYDEKLAQAELETAPVVETGTPKVQSVVQIDPKAKKKPSVSQRYKQQTKQRGMLWICGLLGLISIVGIGYLVATQTSFGRSMLGLDQGSVIQPKVVAKKSDPKVPDRDLVNDTDTKAQNDPVTDVVVKEPVDTGETNNSTSSVPMDDNRPSRPTPSADQLRELGTILSDAKRALENQELEEAKRLLAKARSMPAREKDREKHERLVTLTEYVSDYWKATDDALRRLRGGNELMIDGRRIMLVEINNKQLVVRAEGQNKTYQRDDLPMWFRVGLADSWFDPNAASTKVFRGAMMAVTSEFGPEKARTMWQEAQKDGADLAGLELVLDDNYDLAK